jgi:phosphatidylglycerol:prolipoprotein diacylglycerol transferase
LCPVLFHIGSFPVRSFDVLVVLGMIAGVVLSGWRAQRAGLGGARVMAGIIAIVLVGLAGSRLGIVIVDLGYYIHHWREIFSLYGTGFQGALVTGILAALALARYLRVSFWRLGDLLVPGVVLGQAIGRLGCFLNGCCYGRPTDSFLGVYLPGYGAEWAYRYPTQIIHSVANLLILVVLLRAERHKPFEGFLLLLYGLLYSTQRLLIDFLRETGPTFADHLPLAGVRITRVLSVATILLAAVMMGWRWVRARRVRAQ